MSQLMVTEAAKLSFQPPFLTIVKFGPHRSASTIRSHTFAQALDQVLMAGAEAPACIEVHDKDGMIVRYTY